jgi:hypothetical protein
MKGFSLASRTVPHPVVTGIALPICRCTTRRLTGLAYQTCQSEAGLIRGHCWWNSISNTYHRNRTTSRRPEALNRRCTPHRDSIARVVFGEAGVRGMGCRSFPYMLLARATSSGDRHSVPVAWSWLQPNVGLRVGLCRPRLVVGTQRYPRLLIRLRLGSTYTIPQTERNRVH